MQLISLWRNKLTKQTKYFYVCYDILIDKDTRLIDKDMFQFHGFPDVKIFYRKYWLINIDIQPNFLFKEEKL